MSSSINTEHLRTLSSKELHLELSTLQLRLSDDAITQQLLSAVERGSISTSVFAAWFGVCKSPVVVQQSLKQKVSLHIRLLGIKQLKSGLESTQWEKLWDGLGGTAGLLDIFSDLSVVEVKTACKAIGRCTRGGNVASKRARVTELFKGLHPDIFPDAAAKTNDLRPLTRFYQALVPSCTPELVDWVMSEEQEGNWRYIKEKELLEHHSDSIGRIAYRSVFEHQSPDAKSKDRLEKLSTRFPATTTSEMGCSASMAFALQFLRYIVEASTRRVEDEWVVNNLIRPLLRRAVRKHASWSITQEIVTLSTEFLKHHRNAAKTLTNANGGVLHMVALCWSRRSALFETQLKHLLGIVFGNTTSFGDIDNLLVGVPKSRRYALLHLSCQEVMGVDLDSEQGLSKARGWLPSSMLNRLEAPHALGLFQRLRSARGDLGLVDLGLYSSVLVTTQTSGAYEGDPDIYYLVLLNRNGLYQEAESYAANVLELRKKTTKTTSNRDTRAEHALSVWACANASGSLRLLSETVQWAKGFVRDQLTASRLFSAYYDETYRLLSGFFAHSNAALKPQVLRQRVEVANTIMTDLLSIACSALREPFFRSHDWNKTTGLFTQVIKARVKLSVEMKKEVTVSDEDMYSALWEDTLAMLLRVEKVVNQEEYEKLDANTISGIVMWQSVFHGIESKTLGGDFWMFLDNLAKARNGLWTDLRPTRYPDVLTLPKPFPRGLPVQHLLASWTPDVADLDELAPFIFSRMKAALFVNPEAALEPAPSGKRTQQAIGAFVDGYRYALRAYIPDICAAQVKEKRLREVWSHATGPLSSQRMDSEEAFRYWKRFIPSYLQVTLSGMVPKKERVRWPVVPKSDDPSQTQEWNPLEGRPADVKIQARKLGKATYIDFSTVGEHVQRMRPSIQSHCQPPTPQIPAETNSVGSIWSEHRVETESEAGALAALLYLDAKYATAERLLPTPFPSPNDVRYPCLYLDEAFLSSDELRVSDAVNYIALNTRHAPLPLVHKMAATLVGRLSHEQNSHMLEGAAWALLCALINSDRPGLAFDLAIQVIVDQPNASSWHRVLFNNTFLQEIPASDARKCIFMYAEAIGRKIDAQKRDAKARAEAEQSEKIDVDGASTTQRECARQSDQPFIKITTLKSLAQILHGSTYIGDDASLEILSSLSERVTHVDVRVSILKTLLSKLEVHRPKLWCGVLSNLEAFIPLVGVLNERDPMLQTTVDRSSFGGSQSQETTEESHRQSLILPDLQTTTKPTWQEESPMLNAIVNHFFKLESGQLLELYMERILVPVVEALEEQTAKWTTLFLSKYASDNIDILDTAMPPIPKGFQIFDLILSRPGIESSRIPRTILDQYVAYLVFRINPPAPIRRLNQTLKDDPVLRSKPEVRTWLELYGTKICQSWSAMLPFGRVSNFSLEESGNNSAHITAQSYQAAFLKIFTELLWADNPGYDQLAALVSTLYERRSLSQPWWSQYGRTTVEAMIAYVNSIRTKVWEHDPNRTPVVLPDIFPWRLLLLSYPLDNQSDLNPDEVRERSCKAFAQQLAALLDEISGSAYHTKLQQIKDQVKNGQDAMLSAIYLGDISKTRLSWLTTPELLRVDLAAHMILGSKGLDIKPLEGRLKELLDSWIASENEEVRRTGYSVQGILRRRW